MNNDSTKIEDGLKKEAECSYEHEDYIGTCQHPCYKDNELCIFHHTDVEEKKVQFRIEFTERFSHSEGDAGYDFFGFVFPSMDFHRIFGTKGFSGSVDFRRAEFTGDAIFQNTQFFSKASFLNSRFSGVANFESSRFSDDANFRFSQFSNFAFFEDSQFSGDTYFSFSQFFGVAYFGSCQFFGDVGFASSQFSRDANFESSRFSRVAKFPDSQFSGDAFFEFAEFSHDVKFRQSQFFGVADFESCQFSGEADFLCCQFSRDAYFGSCQFSRDADFWNSQFSGDAYFANAQFSGVANFENAQLSGDTFFGSSQFSGKANFEKIFIEKKVSFVAAIADELLLTDLSGSGSLVISGVKATDESRENGSQIYFTEIDNFTGKLSLKNMNMSNVRFAESDLSGFEFYHLNWSDKDKNREMLLADEKDALKESVQKSRIEKYIVAQRVYTQLKAKFASARQYQLADAAQKGELEMRLLQKKETGKWFSFEKAYKWTSDYGNSWSRPFLLWIVTFALLMLYSVLREIAGVKEELYFTWTLSKCIPEIRQAVDYTWRAMFFSNTSGITVSFPTPFISVIARYFGALMIGFSAFAIRRKFRA